MKNVLILSAILLLVLYYLSNSAESYAPRDTPRALAALEDAANRRAFLNALTPHALDDILLDTREAGADIPGINVVLEMGADPRAYITSFVENFNSMSSLYYGSMRRSRLLSSQISQTQDARELQRLQDRMRRIQSEIRLYKNRLENMKREDSFNKFRIAVDAYIDNRLNRRGKNYLPFKRDKMLEVIKFLLDDDDNRADNLIVVEGVKSKNFTISQQQKYAGVMEYIDNLWALRGETIYDVLQDDLPKELVELTKKYF